MLDLNYILENPEQVKSGAYSKGIQVDIEKILELASELKLQTTKAQKLREQRNIFAKQVAEARNGERQPLIEKGKMLKSELDTVEQELKRLHDSIHPLLLAIPNLPKDDVKMGKNDSENEVVRKYRKPTEFTFTPKDHLQLGESLGMIDMERAAKVSGSRFDYLRKDGVLLEYALLQFGMEVLSKEGFIPIIPPVLLKREVMEGLGYMENGGDEDMFIIPKDNLVLVGTAEHALVPMHMDEILQKKDLPLRYMGYSAAFRRESGSYGKDTRGILRVHQFNKLEMVSFVAEGEDDKEHEYLLSLEERLFQMLEIPYQVVKMCSGDLGFPAARKYDIEAWMPAQGKYREVTSVSTVTDFQSRRLNIKYQEGNEKKYAYVLNGTAFSMNRPIIAILENYQQEDGSVKIPQVLQKYMGKEVIK